MQTELLIKGFDPYFIASVCVHFHSILQLPATDCQLQSRISLGIKTKFFCMAQKQLHMKNMHVDYSVTNRNSANLSEIFIELMTFGRSSIRRDISASRTLHNT